MSEGNNKLEWINASTGTQTTHVHLSFCWCATGDSKYSNETKKKGKGGVCS